MVVHSYRRPTPVNSRQAAPLKCRCRPAQEANQRRGLRSVLEPDLLRCAPQISVKIGWRTRAETAAAIMRAWLEDPELDIAVIKASFCSLYVLKLVHKTSPCHRQL